MADRSARNSWVDGLLSLIERVPGPPWVFYLAVSMFFFVGSILLRWWDGSVPYPGILWVPTAFAPSAIFLIATVHYLNRSAGRALANFRPALGDLESRYSQLERGLTRIPQSVAIAAVAIGVPQQVVGLLTSNGQWGIDARTSLVTTIFTIVPQLLFNVFVVAFFLQAIRQLRQIVLIHRNATNIRLYEGGPHTAFSRFTLSTAVIVTVPYVLFGMVINLLGGSSSPIEIVLLVLYVVTSVVLFALPLNGMHRRLVEEKARQLAASGRRFEVAVARLHSEVDEARLDGAAGLERQMAALNLENDRLVKISTWPWSPETLRGFLSALAVPLVIFVLTTLLSRVINPS